MLNYLIHAITQFLFLVISTIAIVIDFSHTLSKRIAFFFANIPRAPKLLTIPIWIIFLVFEFILLIVSYIYEFLIHAIFRFMVPIVYHLSKLIPFMFTGMWKAFKKIYRSGCSLKKYCPTKYLPIDDFENYEKELLHEFQSELDKLKRKHEKKLSKYRLNERFGCIKT
jgi:hypothetical protein